MLIKSFVAFSAALILLSEAYAEISDLAAAPQVDEQTEAETKSPEVSLISAEKLDFRNIDGQERVYFNDEPFSGATQKKNDEGLLITFFYRNGYKHGVAVAYAEDGHLELDTTYRKGHKDGEEITFFENGKPKLKQTFAEDVLNGEEVIFYDNGKPERVNHYLNGKLDGETTYLDRDGNVTKKENYKNGKKNGTEHIISANMLKEENNYVDDVLDGVTKKYDKQVLIEEITYKNGKRNGVSKRYLENGSWSEMEYKDDALNGVAHSYYPDKTLAEIVNYADNQRTGLAEKYNQNGVRTSSENYKNGKLEGISRKFNETGELTAVSYYVNGIEMAVINIDENTQLRDIYKLQRQNNLNKIISNKTLWYPILWLGINLEKSEILNELENEMKMYSLDIADFSVFKRESKSKYEDYNRKLFFGLTPLSYAVNITAPTEILQKFAGNADNIDMENPRGTTALVEAVRLNNLQMVKYLLAHQADVSAVYGGGNTILLYAVKEKVQKEIISELIKAGADVNAADVNGQTPLRLAISASDVALTDVLLANNADIKQKVGGKTLLAYAFENNVAPEIFSRLIIGGADVNTVDEDGNVLLIQALAAGKYDIAQQLLKNGADINLQNQNGDSALSYVLSHDVPENILTDIVSMADSPLKNLSKPDKPLWKILAEQNRYELLKNIIKDIGGVSVKDDNGETVFGYMLKTPNNKQLYELVLSFLTEKEVSENPNLLFEAAAAKNLDIFKKLVEMGADVNARNEKDEAILTYLIKNDYPIEYIKTLANGKLDVNAAKALEAAVRRNNIVLAENLIENGANVNLLTADRESYLMLLGRNQSEMTDLLLKNNAEVNYVPESDKTLLMYAVKQANPTLIKYLLDKGFSVDKADADGNNSMLYVADMIKQYDKLSPEELSSEIKKIVPMLQAKGADIDIQNNNGETLLIRIAKLKNPNYLAISNALIELGASANKKDQYGKTASDYAK